MNELKTKYCKIEMTDKLKIYSEIDSIIETVDRFKIEPLFTEEKLRRQNKIVSPLLNDSDILKTLSYLIAFSQNSNSEIVEHVLKSGNLDKAFKNFQIDEVVKLNPYDKKILIMPL